jgi:isopentenyl diphosphate isomerase/L-lactate dehydrogenase-like FMN-dependent dehydrogenase
MNWLDQLQQNAKNILSKEIYDFVAGGADDESVLERNITAFNQLNLIPRVLSNVKNICTKITLCETFLSSPIIIAPTAPHKLLYENGELVTVKAAEQTNTLMIVSCMASVELEEIAKETKSTLWFQLHIFKNRQVTENLIKRATIAGYKALVVTVDMPTLGDRRRDVENQFKIPDSCLPVNLLQENLLQRATESSILKLNHTNDLLDPAVTWEDIKWLRKITNLPIILKGVLHSDDGKKSVDLGMNGIIISNHGGRQFGATVATMQVLPQMITALNSQIPVLVDGGIRSGTDVLKALALGANAVLIGRPVLWGLAVGGIHGCSGVINQLNKEFIKAMTLCGFPSIASIHQNGFSSIYRMS